MHSTLNVSHTKKLVDEDQTSVRIFDLRKNIHTPRLPLGPTKWKYMRRNAQEEPNELANKSIEQLVRVSRRCVHNHQFREEEELEFVEEFSGKLLKMVIHSAHRQT